jgi:hypothetical protein
MLRPTPSIEQTLDVAVHQRRSVAMIKTIRAGLVSFALVLGTGFVPGVVRVPFLIPRIRPLPSTSGAETGSPGRSTSLCS